eukprot:1161864-Pelagomonas_calceolata.AAC.32
MSSGCQGMQWLHSGVPSCINLHTRPTHPPLARSPWGRPPVKSDTIAWSDDQRTAYAQERWTFGTSLNIHLFLPKWV